MDNEQKDLQYAVTLYFSHQVKSAFLADQKTLDSLFKSFTKPKSKRGVWKLEIQDDARARAMAFDMDEVLVIEHMDKDYAIEEQLKAQAAQLPGKANAPSN